MKINDSCFGFVGGDRFIVEKQLPGDGGQIWGTATYKDKRETHEN